jgi:hypothetical protein
MRVRRSFLPWIAFIALGCGAEPPAAEPIDNREFNFQLDLPTGWVREARKPSWEKDGIREGAVRRLEKLDDGTPAKGEGARMHASVIDAPKDKTLAELAADPVQRAFLMRDFGKEEAWPPVEVEDTKIVALEGTEGEVPAVRLLTNGTALNLAETDASPCRGMMLMAIAGNKLYRLKLLAWTTPSDEEGLRYDLDGIEVSFGFIQLKKEKPKEDPSKRPGGPGDAGGPPKEPEESKPVGDSEEEKVIDQYFVIEGWKVKKPKRVATMDVDKEKMPNRRIHLQANDTHGSCDITLDVYPNEGFDALGNPLRPQDIQKAHTTSWWQQIVSQFEKGAIVTYAWPKRKGGNFVAMPLVAPETEKVVYDEPKRRPKIEDVDIDAVLRMPGPWVEEVAKPMFGKVKCKDAYRGVVRGNAKTIGNQTTIRFGWRTEKNTFFIWINIARDGLKRYAMPVKEFLDSLEVTK